MSNRLLAAAALLLPAFAAQAQSSAAELYRDADLALGARLIKEHRCAECHVRRVGGDGSAIYRPAGRINTPGFLRGMVEQCNTEMNLGLFPEEVTAIAAVLNRDHYKFK
jgi:mono/diheme cytochrome c family protein